MLNKSLVMTTKASLGQELLRKTARPGFNLYVLRTRPLRFVANRYVECNSIADATLGIGLPLARLHQICKDLQTVYMTRNLKLVLAYDGSEFSGWQVQPDAATIQGTLASAIGRVTGEKVLPQGSGRTDAGVHAQAQVATFATESSVPAENFVKALNDVLPASVRVLEVEEAAADFHARKSARAKTYRYRIYRAAICPPFLARYVWHYPFPLDEPAMVRAASSVEG